jgi:hypothetical protein
MRMRRSAGSSTGQFDITLVICAADNGASGEGSPNGSVNEGKIFNAWPDTIQDNLDWSRHDPLTPSAPQREKAVHVPGISEITTRAGKTELGSTLVGPP